MKSAPSASLFYLIGFPGTGKFAIASELARLGEMRLVDNHLINNPVFSLIEADGITPLPPAVWDKVKAIRRIVIETIEQLSPRGSFVFTNVLVDDSPDDLSCYHEIEALADRKGCAFFPVRIVCHIDEHRRRVASPERAPRFKMSDPDAVEAEMRTRRLLPIDHPHALTLDVTHLTAKESALRILHHASQ